jgi:hypothetical protein
MYGGPCGAVRPYAPYFFEGSVVVGLQCQLGEYAMDLPAAQRRATADGRRVEAASVQGVLHVLSNETGELEAVSAEELGLRGLDGDGRTVMRVVALSTAAGGVHRLVVEEELRGTSGRVGPDGYCSPRRRTHVEPWCLELNGIQ